jgi:hypothetical protein
MRGIPWLRKVGFWSLLLVLLTIPGRSDAGGPIDGQSVISADAEQEVHPEMAYNSQREEYLVVWYNDRGGCDDIRAQRMSKDGVLVGGPFYVSAGCPADRRYPDVAYNSTHDQYLVVWEQEESANGYSIQARRVSGTGQVVDNTDITIRGPGYNTYTPVEPAVAYASTSDRYLVVWSETWHPMPITYGIYGQVMDEAGNLDGSRFPISEGGESRDVPDVAYNRHANRYLVVWQQDAGPLWDIHGQQVHGGGGTFGSDILIAYYTRSSTNPAVAAIPTTSDQYKFLVVWEIDYAPGDRDIYGLSIEEDGTPNSTDVKISTTNSDESSPAIGGMERNLQYFVAWRHSQGVVDKPIKGRTVSHDGSLVGQVAEFSGVDADHPSVAVGPVGDFSVAWQDQPVSATNTNIYGQLWGNRTYLPLLLRNHR